MTFTSLKKFPVLISATFGLTCANLSYQLPAVYAQPTTPAAAPVVPAPVEHQYILSPRVAKLPRKIFAHYMGCWPAGAGALAYARGEEPKYFHHDSPNETYRIGGHIRNWDYVPPDQKMTLEESADLEIRRALHIGIDGFTIDAWAGGNDAKATLDALFKVAEEKNYPFEITISPDPNSLGKESAVDAIKYLLDKHGNSPKLARREGKPLILAYQSIWAAVSNNEKFYAEHPEWQGKLVVNEPILRNTPEGWNYLGQAMQALEQKVGQPLYLEFCMSAFNYGLKSNLTKEQQTEAAGVLAKYVGAVGAFGPLPDLDVMGENVLKGGAEWMFPIGLGQKENLPWESFGTPGAEWFLSNWYSAIKQNSTLLQYITWNDYGENTALAPAYNTRYALYDLTSYFIAYWKHGEPPVPDHDKVYLIYHKYPKGAKIFPFKGKFPRATAPTLQILTILPRPATIRAPGRTLDGQPVQYEVPAGLFLKTLPNDPGPVIAEVVRGGKVTTRLQSPEPITDKPFREDNGFVAYSSEEAQYWKSDFGDKPLFNYSEYGDDDKDGLPNWFEMYWFGKWLDFSTDTVADPNADPDHDGKTNLQEYEDQTDPTLGPAEEAMVGKFPRPYLLHHTRGELFQAGKVELPIANASFEEGDTVSKGTPPGITPTTGTATASTTVTTTIGAANWTLVNGAVRTKEKASDGRWSVKLPASDKDFSSIAQPVGNGVGYSWNSDPLTTYALRPGCVVGYAVDVASGADAIKRGVAPQLAGGFERWGGPVLYSSSPQFSRRYMARPMNIDRGVSFGDQMGISGDYRAASADKTTAIYLDNFSPLTLLCPQLAISSTAPLALGKVAPNTTTDSTPISISNGQNETLPVQADSNDKLTQMATVLYGVANFKANGAGVDQLINATTDHVGALLMGKDAGLFEFVSPHLGATPRQLKFIGEDGQPGLIGGPNPESETAVVRFKGVPQPGSYAATLRIVTQAANIGTPGLLQPNDPPYNLYYTDIPVTVTVQ